MASRKRFFLFGVLLAVALTIANIYSESEYSGAHDISILTEYAKRTLGVGHHPFNNRTDEKPVSFFEAFFPFVGSYIYRSCTVQSGRLKTSSHRTKYEMREIFRNESINTTAAHAVCEFQHNKLKSSCQVAHAMEQIYKCVAWWQFLSDRPSVLKIQRDQELCLHKKVPYASGYLDMLSDLFQVKIVDHHDGPAVLPFMYGFSAHSPNDLAAIRDRAVAPAPPSCHRDPRIAVLDRRGGSRSLARPYELAEAIRSAAAADAKSYSNTSDALHSNSLTVPVMYFEGKSFDEQVNFMSSTDILISPHGAQLISMPFMPSGGAVIEFFPPDYLYDGTSQKSRRNVLI